MSNKNNAAFNTGRARGRKLCATIVSMLSTHLRLPGSRRLYVYLDIEGTSVVTPEWWYGWASAVNTYKTGGGQPFFAAAYSGAVGEGAGAGHATGDTNNRMLGKAASKNADFTCWGTWLTGPSSSQAYCSTGTPPQWGPFGKPPPNFTADAGLPTLMWQWTESDYGTRDRQRPLACTQYNRNYEGDLDSTTPDARGDYGNDLTDYMLWVPN